MAVIPDSRQFVVLKAVLILASLQFTGASEPLDRSGKITVKWDILSWTGDGYLANVSLDGTPQSRSLGKYHLGWTWSKKEVIWNIQGGRPTEQGDCTGLGLPISCVRTPDIIIDPLSSVPSFEMAVGYSGNTNVTVRIPQKLALKSSGDVYNCGDLKKVSPTRFPPHNGRRPIQASVTWNATCST